MKKVMLTLTGMLLFGLVCVNAQDSLRQTAPPMQEPAQPSTQYSSGQKVRIPTSQVPTSLRQTLKGSQYIGWENSSIYLDKSTNEYSLDLMDGNTVKSYRFDQNGKPIKGNTSIKTDVPPVPEAPAPEK